MSDPVTPADSELHDDSPGPIEPTGHTRIDEALDRLDRLDEREITSHPAEFDAVHRVLRESLAGAGRDEDG